MSTDAYIIFPNTPLAKRVSLETLEQLHAHGQIQNDTPCIFAGDPTPLTVQDVLIRARTVRMAGSPVRRGDEGGAPDPAPVAMDDGPEALTEEERYYLLSNNLILPRDLPHLDRRAALALIGAHRRKGKAKSLYALLGGLAALGAVGFGVFWMLSSKACAADDSAAKPVPAATTATTASASSAAKPVQLTPEEARAKRIADKIAAREAAAKKNAEAMKERLAAEKAEAEKARAEYDAAHKESSSTEADKESEAARVSRRLSYEAEMKKRTQDEVLMKWIAEKLFASRALNDKLVILYDGARGDAGYSAGDASSGVIAQWNGKRFVFLPLSAMALFKQPAIKTLDGKTLDLTTMTPISFGSADIIGFYMGDVAPLSDQEKAALDSVDPNVLGPARFKYIEFDPYVSMGGAVQCYAVGGSRRVVGNISSKKIVATPMADGYWELKTNDKEALLGFLLMDYNSGDVMGFMVRVDYGNRDVLKYQAYNISNLGEPTPVPMPLLLSELAVLRQISNRTQSFGRLANQDFSTPFPDSRMNGSIESASSKVKMALARKTASLRDTTHIMELYFEELSDLIDSDIQAGKVTLPSIQVEIARQRVLRQDYLDRIKRELKDTDLAKLK